MSAEILYDTMEGTETLYNDSGGRGLKFLMIIVEGAGMPYDESGTKMLMSVEGNKILHGSSARYYMCI
jgi:hypothetical protein